MLSRITIVLFAACWGFADFANAADIDECRELLMRGKYSECVETTGAAIEKGVYGESWHLVKADAELKLGQHADALATIDKALERYGWSIRLRLAAIEACKSLDKMERVEKHIEEIGELVQASPWRYTDAENLVNLGKFVLQQGADAKSVQDAFFSRAKKNNPLHRSPVIALGELALDKRDFQLAAEIFEPALESHPNDPEIHFGMARAFAGSDTDIANFHLAKTLELNPNHDQALLLQVDRAIDGEQYEDAEVLLKQVLEINSTHAEAIAFRSAIALLQSDDERGKELRNEALSTWTTNPLVDHVIGRELSQKYRFEQGSLFQRQALQFDEDYVPAKKQLVQDLMRLGRESEGWELADQLHDADPYDIAMYNLVTLRDELEKFETIEGSGFAIRMDAREAKIYGHRVLTLLTEAREKLTAKYEHELPETILVEIFPRPSDFEVRTFGMPGIPGFLGVCFGDVITANSPASQAATPVNLDSVLWHEFTHVVTLNKTNNRMPRWLSEGISVYEERQRNPAWGEQMNATYRKMILDGELSPIGQISQMFLSPDSPIHVQFAYFQSSLVVEHIIENYGFDSLLKILDDLAIGMNINEAIERQTEPLAKLDEDFSKLAKELANAYGEDLDWTKPDFAEIKNGALPIVDILAWAEKNPKNYVGLKMCAEMLLELDDVDAATELLENAVELFPYETGDDSPFLKLAAIYRNNDDTQRERESLVRLVEIDDAPATALQRLIEIATDQEDWQALHDFAEQLLQIKPLIPQPHLALATAAEQLDQPQSVVNSINSLLEMEPADPAGLNYRAGVQYHKLGKTEPAVRHTLMALEEAPRFRVALKLLVELKSQNSTTTELVEEPSDENLPSPENSEDSSKSGEKD